jgi:hypothetical protein
MMRRSKHGKYIYVRPRTYGFSLRFSGNPPDATCFSVQVSSVGTWIKNAAASQGEFAMTNQQQGRDPNDKSTNIGQQHGNDKDKSGQSGQQQQSHPNQGQQGNPGSNKPGQQNR